jgi:hypothetical protein
VTQGNTERTATIQQQQQQQQGSTTENQDSTPETPVSPN